MSRMYLRKYRVLVKSSGNTALDVSDLRCAFTVEKAVKEDPNYSEVHIYNLSDDAGESMVTEGSRVILEAGYQDGPYGLIFSGDVVQALRSREDGVTKKLTLVCQDGDKFLTSNFVTAALLRGSKPADVVGALVGQGRVTAEMGTVSPDLSEQRLSRGKVVFGSPWRYLRQLAQGEGAQWYVDDGKVNIVKAQDVAAGEAVELNPATGLIEAPTQTEDGIEGKCLLNPQIKLNTLIHIDPSLIEEAKKAKGGKSKTKALAVGGVYRILSLAYEGDTRGDDWYVSFQAVAQPGRVPALCRDGAENPWR